MDGMSDFCRGLLCAGSTFADKVDLVDLHPASATDLRLIEIIEVFSRGTGYVHREPTSRHSQLTGSQ